MLDTLHTEIGEEPYDTPVQHDVMLATKMVLGIAFVFCMIIFVLAVIGIIKKLRK